MVVPPPGEAPPPVADGHDAPPPPPQDVDGTKPEQLNKEEEEEEAVPTKNGGETVAKEEEEEEPTAMEVVEDPPATVDATVAPEPTNDPPMTESDDDDDDEDPDGWSRHHHLVGHTTSITYLRADDGAQTTLTVPAVAFLPEDPVERQPALWRHHLHSNNNNNNKHTVLAVDYVAADMQQQDNNNAVQSLLLNANLNAVQERLSTVLLDRMWTHVLPQLVLIAALEEMRAQYLKVRQAQKNMASENNNATTSAGHRGMSSTATTPPAYYTTHPNQYLKAPETTQTTTTGDSPSDVVNPAASFTFTPNQLVHRIKAGCSLAWGRLEAVLLPSAEQLQRFGQRTSRRLARLAQDQQTADKDTVDDEALVRLWKVTTGGSVATFIMEQYGVESDDAPEDKVNDDDEEDEEEEGSDEEEKGSDEEEEEEEEDLGDNPYLRATNTNVAEWLGRKTAKFLSNSDLQNVFSPLLYHAPQKGKKKVPIDAMGRPALDVMSVTDQTIWQEATERSTPISSDARLCLESTMYEDVTDLADWETAHFGRTYFCLRLVGQDEEKETTEATVADDTAMVKFKEDKAWHTWRFKGIHGGHTVWPSWRSAAEAWRRLSDTTTNNNASVSQADENEADPEADRELAQAIAEQEDATMVTGRRSRRGVDTGTVFYGNQSSLTLKQLMDAMLRKTSERPFATLLDLLTAMQDDSTDPIRRMRNGLGRLVYRRNQLALREVSTDLTDKDCLDQVSSVESFKVLPDGDTEGDQEDVKRLAKYMKDLLYTELWLRRLVVKHLTQIPTEIIATAADERPGSMDAIDSDDFENPDELEWQYSGHELIGKLIFRPVETRPVDNPGQCYWFRIEEFVPSVDAPADPNASTTDRPNLGRAKDTKSVERRIRFKALRLVPPGKVSATLAPNENPLILTEGQVRAGIKAAMLDDTLSAEKKQEENPMRGRAGAKVSLVPVDGAGAPKVGVVAGHSSGLSAQGALVHKMLILFESTFQDTGKASAWAVLDTSNDALRCRIDGKEEILYSVQEFDYDSNSDAFKECRNVITHLERHARIAPFLEPVDPVALNIPTYFQVVKRPMDLSTVKKKLENGDYSRFSLSETIGSTAVARMLNGPFRRDVELMFNNAILFNPPDDWIHKAAVSLKSFASKKIEQACQKVEQFEYSGRFRARQSIYIEYDSDTDMYGFDDEKDEDYDGSANNRKRKRTIRTATKEDPCLKAIERGIPLAKVLPDGETLRGPFGNFPVNTDASSFALPPDWTCHRSDPVETAVAPASTTEPVPTEIDDLMDLRAQLEDQNAANLRRSTRAAAHEPYGAKSSDSSSIENVAYDCVLLDKLDVPPPTDRKHVEMIRERLHEEYFSKLYKSMANRIDLNALFAEDDETKTGLGFYSNGAFPPYLGNFFPSDQNGSGHWEIRSPFIVAALRWVIRGLIESEHLGTVEALAEESTKSGVVLPNNIYYYDDSLSPFDVCDQKEFSRRKKAKQEDAEDSDDDDIELSQYEQERLARVARNAERLKALGLA